MHYITTVRARLKDEDPEAAQERHNGIVARLRPQLEPKGGTSHMVFANSEDPREFLAVDRWDSMEGLAALQDPAVQGEIGSLFDGPPQVTVWAVREGWSAY
ncbi:MAG: putative quinol monooxygenase [Chloroflexota bacterium]